MRIHEPLGFAKASRADELLKWSRDYAQDVGHYFRRVTRLLNGEISLGDGRETSNVKGQWINIISNGAAGTESAISHTLGVVPAGFILAIPPQAGIVNNGTTAWTATTIYIKTSVGSQSIRLFLLAPPEAS